MSNEDRRHRRNYLRAALRANQARRDALIAAREANVHAVDIRSIWEATSGDYELTVELCRTGGGSPYAKDFLTRTD